MKRLIYFLSAISALWYLTGCQCDEPNFLLPGEGASIDSFIVVDLFVEGDYIFIRFNQPVDSSSIAMDDNFRIVGDGIDYDRYFEVDDSTIIIPVCDLGCQSSNGPCTVSVILESSPAAQFGIRSLEGDFLDGDRTDGPGGQYSGDVEVPGCELSPPRVVEYRSGSRIFVTTNFEQKVEVLILFNEPLREMSVKDGVSVIFSVPSLEISHLEGALTLAGSGDQFTYVTDQTTSEICGGSCDSLEIELLLKGDPGVHGAASVIRDLDGVPLDGDQMDTAGDDFFLTLIVAEDLWSQKPGFSGSRRTDAVGFSIGNKGYIGTGWIDGELNDLWEFDPQSGQWVQKADFPGEPRSGAVSFVINGKGYVGTGERSIGEGFEVFSNFWEYDPVGDVWKRIADLPGNPRSGAVGFAIGKKGYVATGMDSSGTYLRDLWEYDPAEDAWTPKARFPGLSRFGAVAFTADGIGYVGTGWVDGPSNDFWLYDPSNDQWEQIENLPGDRRGEAAALSLAGKGYVGTGANDDGAALKDFWEYDPGARRWKQMEDFQGGARMEATGFAIGSSGCIGTGWNDGYLGDFWRFSP